MLWYDLEGVAMWINPVLASSLLYEDMWKAGFSEQAQAELYEHIDHIVGHEGFFTRKTRPKGCLNPAFPSDLGCYGNSNLGRFDRERTEELYGTSCRN